MTQAPAAQAETPPGAEPRAPDLARALAEALAARGPGYQPRTRHLAAAGAPRWSNRLLLESSPYLQQHAHNPVDWYPWGDDAFAAAARLGRPVLLSVGYSTCHWCHVMEEESFEDEEVARLVNELYIPVKVDREERPDVDAVYMAAVQALTGHGGWPMTVWLAPDRRPYYGGTYFPARDGDRGTRVGFATLLAELRAVYDRNPARVEAAATEIVAAVTQRLGARPAAAALPTEAVLHSAYRYCASAFDPDHGGLGGAPKFPSSLPVRFMLRYHRRFGDRDALAMAETTLAHMAAGGLRDHAGGGFHRYTVDDRWLVPHFEKMLYDNALLTLAYLEGHQATGRQDFAAVAAETLRYVEAEMTSPEGAFYSATDADSPNPDKGGEREEGWFFTWTPAELEAAIGPRAARLVAAYYDVTPRGNFEDGRSILHTPRPLAAVAADLGMTPDALSQGLADARAALYAARAKRPPPLLDDKILAAWNGLMISAFARGAQVLGEPRLAAVAARAAAFVLDSMQADGRLLRSYKDGRARHAAYLEDYAFMIVALVDLFEADADPRWLREALRLAGVVEARFADRDGGYFMTADDHEALLVREKPSYDGAVPSGNSLMAQGLLRLAALTGDEALRRRAEGVLRAFAPVLAQAPVAMAELLIALDFHADRPKQVIVVTKGGKADAAPFLTRLARAFVPNKVVAVVDEAAQADIAALVPLVRGKTAEAPGRATAYVCIGEECRLPTTSPDVFAGQLES